MWKGRRHRVWTLMLVQALALWLAVIGCVAPIGLESLSTAPTPEPAASQFAPNPPAATAPATPVATATPLATPSPTLPPFTPQAVSAPDCAYGGVFRTIEALDRYTVRFALCKPEPAFLSKIAFPSMGIQSQEWLESNGGGGAGSLLLERPVGTGPYQLESWRRGEELVLRAFENYWGPEKARTPRVIFRWSPDPGERLVELQAGVVDGIDQPASADFQTIQSDPELKLALRPALNTAYLGMNRSNAPFDNELVRQAIAMGIDRQQLVKTAFPPEYLVADFFTPCVIPNACAGEPWYPYDPARARELLAQAGFPDGFETELAYRGAIRGYMPRPDEVARAIRDQLEEDLNIRARLKAVDSNQFLQAVDQGTLQGLYLLGWGADYPDVANFLDAHFGAQAFSQFGAPIEPLVQALAQGAGQSDPAARRPFYEAANQALRQYAPVTPLAHGGWIMGEDQAAAFRQSAVGAYVSPLGIERFDTVQMNGQDTFTWMQVFEPLSLYCADETGMDAWRACSQMLETLYRYTREGADVEPALAESCQPSQDLLTWTCSLRQGILFHDGSLLDANDVVTSYAVQWDASHPLHKGNSGEFAYFKTLWGEFLNAK